MDCFLFLYVRLLLMALDGTTKSSLGDEVGSGAVEAANCESGTSTIGEDAESLRTRNGVALIGDGLFGLGVDWMSGWVAGKGKGEDSGSAS